MWERTTTERNRKLRFGRIGKGVGKASVPSRQTVWIRVRDVVRVDTKGVPRGGRDKEC